MRTVRNIYRVVRAVLFTVIITVAVLYGAVYVLLAMPAVQNQVKLRAELEASKLLKSKVEIGCLTIRPFSELSLHDLAVFDPEGNKVISAANVGAGIRIWKLLSTGRIELSYAEIVGLDARVVQSQPGEPLNIQFIIDAFAPKDKTKPPTQFELALHTAVLRRCSVSFDREWQPAGPEDRIDFNHLRICDLKADLRFPVIGNDKIDLDLRRLAFKAIPGFELEKLSFLAQYSPTRLDLKKFVLQLPGSELKVSDISLRYTDPSKMLQALTDDRHEINLTAGNLSPKDFACFYPSLHDFEASLSLNIDIAGNRNCIESLMFKLTGPDLSLAFDADAAEPFGELAEYSLHDFEIRAGQKFIAETIGLFPGAARRVREICRQTGNVKLKAEGDYTLKTGKFAGIINLESGLGNIKAEAAGNLSGKSARLSKCDIDAQDVDMASLLSNSALGLLSAVVSAHDVDVKGRETSGFVELEVPDFQYRGIFAGGLKLTASRAGQNLDAEIEIDNEVGNAWLAANAVLNGDRPTVNLNMDINRFEPWVAGWLPKYHGYDLTAAVNASVHGLNPEGMTGVVEVKDFRFAGSEGHSLDINSLKLSTADLDDGVRDITLASEYLDANFRGRFKFKELVDEVKDMASRVVPSLLAAGVGNADRDSDMEFNINLKPNNGLTEFFGLPFRLLVNVPVTGMVDATSHTAALNIKVPYLQQGRNKLVRDTRLDISLDAGSESARAFLTSTFPAKKGDMTMRVNIMGQDDTVFADLDWETPENHAFDGEVSLNAQLSKNEFSGKPDILLDINPSKFIFGNAEWNIDKSSISYGGKEIDIDDLKIWHDRQFVAIDGRGSVADSDTIKVALSDIDLGYVFETLNINYVNFGGTASGELTASGIFGSDPVAKTDGLAVQQLTYNGAVLGDAVLKSHWDNVQKEVTIRADIEGRDKRRSVVDGGIWVTRDSLSFDIDADHVPVGFLAPFMSAFCSGVKGEASGNAKLFGTFSDIDLTGRLFADSVAMKLDFTNVWYHGSDSIFFDPGKIIVPEFRLYDRNGRSAILTGELKHRYFHDPEFLFKVQNARGLLCYDTNSSINPDWYGTFYGNGSATVQGEPGTVRVGVDMTATGKSTFTFVLSDTQAAEDFAFLTFSDRRKEEAQRVQTDSVQSILAAFQKQMQQEGPPSRFLLDLRASVTPSTLMTLVMDPVAGDKITARGNGNIQMDYDSENESFSMLGKYVLDEGTYNFSLQDLILRDFKIRQGSSIAFNGDPMNGILDITATYRVNTNLSDLDKSFANDRDLTRTNVPVDAVLMVDGEMTHPDITFDIELPTLTQDVTRKVKSIISTDDMMSRQIIYLLALNRFYTPEYMGQSSNGSEFASIASTTLSTQLSNMLGQLTDKFTVAPSFRSDKGDFSDFEMDVALSSRLLNNRLLVNGNFGYRDRSTSSTTFVGDFDIEYLLSRGGNLRLKAYNHFNDQNYYLRQALTTQGLGVIYRKDFDNPFGWLRRGKKDDCGQPATDKKE